eukprot:snap_masked-scaffold_14-processed-gene-0.16-mRNA-1 protein AED:1.00 eAED:1.00 QI:0/-1/0/0/-1/1/1/0/724
MIERQQNETEEKEATVLSRRALFEQGLTFGNRSSVEVQALTPNGEETKVGLTGKGDEETHNGTVVKVEADDDVVCPFEGAKSFSKRSDVTSYTVESFFPTESENTPGYIYSTKEICSLISSQPLNFQLISKNRLSALLALVSLACLLLLFLHPSPNLSENALGTNFSPFLIYFSCLFCIWVGSKVLINIFISFLRWIFVKDVEKAKKTDAFVDDEYLSSLKMFILFTESEKNLFARLCFFFFMMIVWIFQVKAHSETIMYGAMCIRLHVTIILLTLADIAAKYTTHRYFQSFRHQHITDQVYDSLFEQVLLTQLLGAKSSKICYMLPNEYIQQSKKVDKEDNTADKTATQYALGSRYGSYFSGILGVRQDGVQLRKSIAERIEERFLGEQKDGLNSLDTRNNEDSLRGFPGVLKLSRFSSTRSLGSRSTGSSTASGRRKVSVNTLIRFINVQDVLLRVDKIKSSLDKNDDGYVTMDQIREFLEEAFEKRSTLRNTIKDSRGVADQVQRWLHYVFIAVVMLICIFVWNLDSAVFLTFSSFLLAFSFAFGNSIREIFENVVFLYAVKPYEVLDFIRLGDDPTVYQVVRVLLHFTEVKTVTGEYMTIRNSVMNSTNPILNYSRSSGHRVVARCCVDVLGVNKEKMDRVQKSILEYVKKEPEIFLPSTRIDFHDFQPPLKVDLKLLVNFCIPYSSLGVWKPAYSRVCYKFYELLADEGITVYTQHYEE